MVAIVKELTIAAAPERVWGALTQPDEIGHWWTNDLNATPEVGSLAEFRFGEWGDFVLRFEVAELEDEVYEQTRANWNYFLTSLKSYLETGKGAPGVPPFAT